MCVKEVGIEAVYTGVGVAMLLVFVETLPGDGLATMGQHGVGMVLA